VLLDADPIQVPWKAQDSIWLPGRRTGIRAATPNLCCRTPKILPDRTRVEIASASAAKHPSPGQRMPLAIL